MVCKNNHISIDEEKDENINHEKIVSQTFSRNEFEFTKFVKDEVNDDNDEESMVEDENSESHTLLSNEIHDLQNETDQHQVEETLEQPNVQMEFQELERQVTDRRNRTLKNVKFIPSNCLMEQNN